MRPYRKLSARLQYLQYVIIGYYSVLHYAMDMLLYNFVSSIKIESVKATSM